MHTWNACVLLLLLAGNLELLIAIHNRCHSLPIRTGALRPLRFLHRSLMTSAVAAFGIVAFVRPGLAVGGRWDYLPNWCWTWFGFCTAGLAGLVWSVLRWQFRPRPPGFVSEQATVHDTSRLLPESPVGSGPYAMLAAVPLNEYLQIEAVEKTYHLNRLSVQSRLRVLHLSDIHFIGQPALEYYQEVIRIARTQTYDMIVFTGDLLDDERLRDWTDQTLCRLRAKYGCYFILGNHDWYLGDDCESRRQLTNAGWIDVSAEVAETEINGQRILIGGSEVPWMGHQPEFPNDPAAVRILLSHSPDNMPWAVRNGIDLMLSGHNHGGQIALPLVGPVYAPSWSGVRYAGGDYYREPTLLHVSRGLGAKHPLRINSRPELPTLVLLGRQTR